jgi:hypothetical protein
MIMCGSSLWWLNGYGSDWCGDMKKKKMMKGDAATTKLRVVIFWFLLFAFCVCVRVSEFVCVSES